MEDEDGSFLLALGGSGGSRIFGAIFQVILGLDWGLDISQAIEYPRLHNQLYPTIVDIDSGYPLFGINALSERGHNISGLFPILFQAYADGFTVLSINRITSVVQGVTVRNGTIYGAFPSVLGALRNI
jgi:gamma-glutamyltranspeptidase / glutathione hydrolase / leukotriene-C4 hydrolase